MSSGRQIVERVNMHCALTWCKRPEHDCRKGNDNMSACARCLEEAIDAALQAERVRCAKAVRERCAEIAERQQHTGGWGHAIARAIRAQESELLVECVR